MKKKVKEKEKFTSSQSKKTKVMLATEIKCKDTNIVKEESKDTKREEPELVFNWSLHYECNYRCQYCFFYGHWQEQPQLNKQIPIEEWLKAWHRIYERFGSANIELTGGEPCIYPSFVRLISELSKEHFCSVVTNLSCNMQTLVNLIEHLDNPAKVEMPLSFHPLFAKFDEFAEKAIFLKNEGIFVKILYVAHPPQLKQMTYFKNKFEEKGLIFVPILFRGKYNGLDYPDGYTDEEKGLLYSLSEQHEEGSRRWVENQIAPAITEGRLCRAGQRYAHIEIDGTVYRCHGYVDFAELSDWQISKMGNFFENFKLLNEPSICKLKTCLCEFKWLVEQEEPQGKNYKE